MCNKRNVRLLGFQMERLKIRQLTCSCFLTFIIPVNYGAKLDLPLLCAE